jgi:endonuclease III
MGTKAASNPEAAVPRVPPASRLVQAVGGRFSAELGICVSSDDSSELFKWLLAATLFGARISENLAKRTYREFAREKLLSPKSLLRRGWDGVVEVLDRGGYARYDFKTATKLLELSTALLDRYGGDLKKLHASATDCVDLAQKIKGLAKGIGDVTANIFLRELRGVWQKAEPPLSEPVLAAVRHLRLLPAKVPDKARTMELLKQEWIREGNRLEDFPDLEAALVRYGLALRRQGAASGRQSGKSTRSPGRA